MTPMDSAKAKAARTSPQSQKTALPLIQDVLVKRVRCEALSMIFVLEQQAQLEETYRHKTPQLLVSQRNLSAKSCQAYEG